MRVGYYLDNSTIAEVDLSMPWLGNPGIGGTKYRFVTIPWAITEFGEGRHTPVLLASHTDRLPEAVEAHVCDDINKAPAMAKELGIKALAFRPWSDLEAMRRVADELHAHGVEGLAWAGNALDPQTFAMFAEHPGLNTYISVGREIVDYYRDLSIIYKSTYIFNGLRTDGIEPKSAYPASPKIVSYIGSLINAKGFHRLAEIWPAIKERHPDAELEVIGSGQLYDRSCELGPLGLAERSYEELFLPHLTDDAGDLLPGITFHGILGVEKYDVMRRASVGVANPTGMTETFCAAAVEYQLLGVPVVSAAEGGLLDTVRHEQTGYLCVTNEQLIDAICGLLDSSSKQQAMGQAGSAFVREQFTFKRAVSEWMKLLDRVEAGEPNPLLPPKPNLRYRSKWFKEAVRVGKRAVPAWRGMDPIESKGAKRTAVKMAKSLVSPKAWQKSSG